MTNRPRQNLPVTAERVEAALDKLAWIISNSSNPGRAAPLWRRLEAELERLREQEAVLAAAHSRLNRTRDRELTIST